MMILLALVGLITPLFLMVSAECGGDVRWRDREALSVMMNSTETRCGDINLTTERRVCEVLSGDDGRHLLCGGNGHNVNCNRSISLCPDGSLNKTCFPLSASNSINYRCICHSILDHLGYKSEAKQASWSSWQQLTAQNKGFNHTRKLYMDSSSECLLQEYKSLVTVNIISEYQLPNSTYSASSVYAHTHGDAHRARIDMYFDYPCGWVAAHNSAFEWLQIQLQPIYYVGGILIGKRCDLKQYPTAVTVKTAEEDLQWQDVIVNQHLLYTDDAATLWFPRFYTTPVWRVYIPVYYSHPSLKCDLKGYRNNWLK